MPARQGPREVGAEQEHVVAQGAETEPRRGQRLLVNDEEAPRGNQAAGGETVLLRRREIVAQPPAGNVGRDAGVVLEFDGVVVVGEAG